MFVVQLVIPVIISEQNGEVFCVIMAILFLAIGLHVNREIKRPVMLTIPRVSINFLILSFILNHCFFS